MKRDNFKIAAKTIFTVTVFAIFCILGAKGAQTGVLGAAVDVSAEIPQVSTPLATVVKSVTLPATLEVSPPQVIVPQRKPKVKLLATRLGTTRAVVGGTTSAADTTISAAAQITLPEPTKPTPTSTATVTGQDLNQFFATYESLVDGHPVANTKIIPSSVSASQFKYDTNKVNAQALAGTEIAAAVAA